MLLYADDTVVFGTEEKEFQNNLDMFYEYSELWHLSINFDKTKIMIFGTRQDQRFNLNLGEHKIDICTVFMYFILLHNMFALISYATCEWPNMHSFQ